jgi:hypothetical protein
MWGRIRQVVLSAYMIPMVAVFGLVVSDIDGTAALVYLLACFAMGLLVGGMG